MFSNYDSFGPWYLNVVSVFVDISKKKDALWRKYDDILNAVKPS